MIQDNEAKWVVRKLNVNPFVVSEVEPTNPNIEVWIDPSAEPSMSVEVQEVLNELAEALVDKKLVFNADGSVTWAAR